MNRLAVSERRILLLYWSPGGVHVRAAVGRHLRALAALPGRNRVLAYNATRGAPLWLRLFRPDAVVLHTTFLGLRWIDGFESRRRRSAWLAELSVPKVALPQDDYDHAAVLDDWLEELGVDVVFTPLAGHATELLPRTSRRAVVRPALTGYVDDDELAGRGRPTQLAGRGVHLVYRATELPWWFGSLGLLKHRVGNEAARRARDLGLHADVSTRPEDAVIRGWLDFLAGGRAVVGAESGSSVLDAVGEVRRAIREIKRTDPEITFDELAVRMPAGWDSHRFAALSPRHLEAASTGTAQLLVEGEYDGVLEANRHYLPVKPDFSNLSDALEETRDPRALQPLADAAYQEICLSGRYSYRRLAEQVDQSLRELGASERPGRPLFARVAPSLAATEAELTRRGAAAAATVRDFGRPRRG